jgi:hypothetical protein
MFLIRLSICSCGYGVLHDDIKLGTKYEVDLSVQCPATYVCGQCGRVYLVTCVPASSVRNPAAAPYPLPLALFQDGAESKQVQ